MTTPKTTWMMRGRPGDRWIELFNLTKQRIDGLRADGIEVEKRPVTQRVQAAFCRPRLQRKTGTRIAPDGPAR